jgi:hypothetical protein
MKTKEQHSSLKTRSKLLPRRLRASVRIAAPKRSTRNPIPLTTYAIGERHRRAAQAFHA